MTTRMREEICEQPAAVSRTVDGLLAQTLAIRQLFGKAQSAVYCAIGTSRNAALYGSRLWNTYLGITSYIQDVDEEPNAAGTPGDAVVVALSQSGESGEILDAVARAQRAGRPTIAITNSAGSSLARAVDLPLITAAGLESAVPATKTYTTQMTALAAIITALTNDSELREGLQQLPAALEMIINRSIDISVVTAAATKGRAILIAGSGGCRSVADEIALKLQETCYLPAISSSEPGALHGPVALLGPESVLLIVAPDRPPSPQARALKRIADRRSAVTISLGATAEFGARCTSWIPAANVPRPLQPILLAVPGQMLAERLAVALGLSPDTPRGLSKITRTTPEDDNSARCAQ